MKILLQWKKLNYYCKAGLLSLPLSIVFLMLLGLLGEIHIVFSEWYLDLMPIPAFIGAQLSGDTYLGRELDLNAPTEKPRLEKWTTGLFILLGLTIGISLSILSPRTAEFFDVTQSILFTINCTGALGGLGNRIGTGFGESTKLPHEKTAMKIGGLLGLSFSIALLATGCVGAISVVGVTSLLTGGIALPFWIAGGITVLQVTSAFTSASDYTAKAVTLIKAKTTDDQAAQQVVKDRPYEYKGSTAGFVVGLLIGIAIVAALTQPHVIAGVLGIATATFIIVTAVSIFSGILNRIGKMLDAAARANKAIEDEHPQEQQQPEHTLSKELVAETPSPRYSSDQTIAHSTSEEHSEKESQSVKKPLKKAASSPNLLSKETLEQREKISATALINREKIKLKRSFSYSHPKSERKLTIAHGH